MCTTLLLIVNYSCNILRCYRDWGLWLSGQYKASESELSRSTQGNSHFSIKNLNDKSKHTKTMFVLLFVLYCPPLFITCKSISLEGPFVTAICIVFYIYIYVCGFNK